MNRSASLPLWALLAGCTSETTVHVSPSAGAAVAFVVTLPAEGPAAIEGPLFVGQSPFQHTLTLGTDARSFLLGFSQRDLNSVHPGVAEDLTAVDLSVSPETCAEGRFEANRVRATLPAGFSYLALEEEGGRMATADEREEIAGAAITIPLDPARCRPAVGPLQPFGAAARNLDVGVSFGGGPVNGPTSGNTLEEVYPIGTDRVVGQTRTVLVLFERGQVFTDDSFHVTREGLASGMVLSGSTVDHQGRILVAARELEGVRPRGQILEYRLQAEGLVFVGTATRTLDGVDDVAVDPVSGVVLAVSEIGVLYLAESLAGPYRRFDAPALIGARHVEATGTAQPAFVVQTTASAVGMVSVSGALRPDVTIRMIESTSSVPLRAIALDRQTGATYVFSRSGGLFRAEPEEGFRRVDFGILEEGDACGVADACGKVRYGGFISGGAHRPDPQGGHVLFTVDECPALISLRAADDCATVLAAEDRLKTVAVGEGAIVVGGALGLVLEAVDL